MPRRARVLLVDDDDDLRRLLRLALEGNEHVEVIADVADGESALTRAREVAPDIVVLDLGLPDIAGRDVLTRLRDAHPGMRVVVFTGNDEAISRASALEWGASEVVVKGEQMSRLLSVIEDVAAGPEEEVASVDLGQDPASVGQARRFTKELLSRWGADSLVENAILVVSELVTNAITHGASTCRVVLRWAHASLRIEVADFGSGSPEPQPQSTVRPSGRGLLIVSTLATAWGIDPSADGKVVWAEIAV